MHNMGVIVERLIFFWELCTSHTQVLKLWIRAGFRYDIRPRVRLAGLLAVARRERGQTLRVAAPIIL
jgi:hypothetical protein